MPVLVLGVIRTAIAYTLGISGIARLRPRFASLVGLSEVMFAVLAAWVLIGEAITADSGDRRCRGAGRIWRWRARATAPRRSPRHVARLWPADKLA